jgi:hypothetical protein
MDFVAGFGRNKEGNGGIVGRLHTIGAVALGAVISFLVAMGVVAGCAFLGLVAQPGPHQDFEIAAVTIGMAIVAVGCSFIFAIVLAAGGRQTAITRTAIALTILLVLVLAAPAVLGLVTTAPEDIEARDALAALATFLMVIAVPGLLAILVQWWTIRRHLDRRRRT